MGGILLIIMKIDKRYADDMPDYASYGDEQYEEPSITYEDDTDEPPEIPPIRQAITIPTVLTNIHGNPVDIKPIRQAGKVSKPIRHTLDTTKDTHSTQSKQSRYEQYKRYKARYPDKVRAYQREWVKAKRAKSS